MRIEYRLDRLSERMETYHKDVLDVPKMHLVAPSMRGCG